MAADAQGPPSTVSGVVFAASGRLSAVLCFRLFFAASGRLSLGLLRFRLVFATNAPQLSCAASGRLHLHDKSGYTFSTCGCHG